jgi:eukaryotic-like serine/threonine-protein kinase
MRSNIGQYRIENVLGRGGMGVVYRGLHESLGRPVAIKALAPELTQQPEFRERFFSEAKTQARLQHPNVVGVYDLLEDGGDYFIVMEMVEGTALDDRLQALGGRGMEVAEAAGIAAQMLAALDYAHSEGVIHRDVKPSNVLITAGGRVKLMDFGIALLVGDKRLTASQSAIGTPVYMSPEQILRPREVDHRSDIYSAAIVLHEMLAGRPPFDDETEYGIKKLHVEEPPPDLDTIRPALPAGLSAAVRTALAKSPEERFASAGLFLRALQEAVPAPVPAGATPLPAPALRPTTLDAPRPTAVPGPATARGTARGAAASAPAAWLARARAAIPPGKERWVALAAVVVAALGLAGVLAVALGGGDELAERVAEETLDATAADARGLEPAGVRLPSEALDAAGAGGFGNEPRLAAEPAPQGLLPGVDAPPPAPRERTTPAPAPVPRKPPQAATARRPEPAAQEAPPTAPASAEPAAPAAEPAPQPEPSAADGGLDEFARIDELVVAVERLSNQTYEAYEAEGRDDQLLEQLDSLLEAAEETRKSFRRTTGTGGVLSSMRGMIRRNRRDNDAEQRVLAAKVQDLQHRVDRIEKMLPGYDPAPLTRQLWGELRRDVASLQGYF